MAYIPTEWKNGDVITAEKLNNIEEGIEENSNFKLIDCAYYQGNCYSPYSDIEVRKIIDDGYDVAFRLDTSGSGYAGKIYRLFEHAKYGATSFVCVYPSSTASDTKITVETLRIDMNSATVQVDGKTCYPFIRINKSITI